MNQHRASGSLLSFTKVIARFDNMKAWDPILRSAKKRIKKIKRKKDIKKRKNYSKHANPWTQQKETKRKTKQNEEEEQRQRIITQNDSYTTLTCEEENPLNHAEHVINKNQSPLRQ